MTTPPPPPPPPSAQAVAPSKTLSLTSMIAGIVGIVLTIFYVGILFDIAAIVLGFLGRSREPSAKGFWLTGLITGFAGLLFSILYIVLIAFVINAAIKTGQVPAS